METIIEYAAVSLLLPGTIAESVVSEWTESRERAEAECKRLGEGHAVVKRETYHDI